MSKAFKKDDDNDQDDDQPEIKVDTSTNYVTPTGHAALQAELRQLYDERPKIVEVVRWAAGNGDRSENGDYIYGKRRLREIDRRIRYLTKRLDSAKIVDPELQKSLTKVFFGATVTYLENAAPFTVQLVGIDEANMAQGKISWTSPVAKALLKSEVGDMVKLKTPGGTVELTIVSIKY